MRIGKGRVKADVIGSFFSPKIPHYYNMHPNFINSI